jgi:periplasmic divalent cation tolerance protein
VSQVSLIYCTVGSRDAALSIGRTLVTEQLAACANVIDGMTSIYSWQGALEESREAVLLLKTRTELLERAMSRVRQLHPYECPAILAWGLTAIAADYERWVCEQTAAPGDPVQ